MEILNKMNNELNNQMNNQEYYMTQEEIDWRDQEEIRRLQEEEEYEKEWEYKEYCIKVNNIIHRFKTNLKLKYRRKISLEIYNKTNLCKDICNLISEYVI